MVPNKAALGDVCGEGGAGISMCIPLLMKTGLGETTDDRTLHGLDAVDPGCSLLRSDYSVCG